MGAVTETLAKLIESSIRATNLADDFKRVLQSVEDLQKQNRSLAETNSRQEEQIKQLQSEAGKSAVLHERILKLENALDTLRALRNAENKAYLQELKLAKHELESYINKRVQQLEDDLRAAAAEVRRSYSPSLQMPSLPPATPPDGDGK